MEPPTVVKPATPHTAALAEKMKARARAKSTPALAPTTTKPPLTPHPHDHLVVPPSLTGVKSNSPRLVPYTGTIIFIGASTGGTEAIREVLTRLPGNIPPILMTQHMPEMFTGSFAARLDSLSEVHVVEAQQGEPIEPGVAYLAPGHSHLLIKRAEHGGYVCELSRGEPVNRHRPSVDVLFDSAAEVMGRSAIGVLLTGMGKDGAMGMLRMMKAGAWTIAQDQATCVVYGMPREAFLLGGVKEVAPLTEIAGRVLQRLRGGFHGSVERARV
ncbi:MAG: chemotaxis protein CheB [Azoarcus sp.]|jgi:two-component system chemotaxis response regulator CheB|nr:chemotaxis protein CheB [Azoarcus sp.]